LAYLPEAVFFIAGAACPRSLLGVNVPEARSHRRDDTERMLALQRDAAVNADKVKSRFLAAASHDLRQPLQTIWTMQAILARALAGTEYMQAIASIEEAVRDMDQMLASLLDVNRLEAGAIRPVICDFPLREIVPRLRAEFAYAATRKALSLELEESAEFVRSDRTLLPAILRNLLGNAIKYTRHGAVRLRVRTTAEHLHVEVSDTGIGIAPDNLRRLFDAFYQVESPAPDSREGVGLGLSIVQMFCRMLGHTVTIESTIGAGSTFTVRLPRGIADESRAAQLPIATRRSTPPAAATTVLHIEDDPGVARSIALLLRLEGYEVVSAATRDEALHHVRDGALRPDLVLSDYQLPMGIRGDTIVAEIAAWLGFKPPTIMLTGDTTDDHIARAGRIADRVLPKPVDVDLLLREIGRLLEGRRAIDARDEVRPMPDIT
jgi:two-component system CheB/CheR fusion protein